MNQIKQDCETCGDIAGDCEDCEPDFKCRCCGTKYNSKMESDDDVSLCIYCNNGKE